MIQLRRVYDPRGSKVCTRFLVERLWPRGVKKTALHLDGWLREVGPSHGLRRWFSHDATKWGEFQRKYFAELDDNPAAWQPIIEAARCGPVELLYSSRDGEHNNAVALREYLESKLRADKARRLSLQRRHRTKLEQQEETNNASGCAVPRLHGETSTSPQDRRANYAA
jgi:uncharacterized protein YeaO (DUF488 family)